MMTDPAPPIDTDRIEQLVESLYLPNHDPQYIKDTQNALQKAQRSEAGWNIGDRLLNSQSPHCQFFGALTFTVKLNSLSEIEIEEGNISPEEILNQLLNWVVTKKNHFQRFVLQKLISTLSVFFTKFPQNWPNCVLSVYQSIHSNTPIINPEENVSDMGTLIRGLPIHDLLLCLQFSTSVIEDQTGSSQLTSAKTMKINEALRKNVPIVSQLIRAALDIGATTNDEEKIQLIKKGLETLEGWITYFTQSRLDVSELRGFSDYLLLYLNPEGNEEIYEACTNIIIDIFTHSPSFWTPKFKENLLYLLLEQGKSIEQIKEVDEDERIVPFAKLLIAFFQNVQQLYLSGSDYSKPDTNQPSHEALSQILQYLIYFTGLPGKPVVEDPIAVDCLEFWTSFVEDIEDMDIPNQSQQAVVKVVINSYFPKVMLPPENQFESWSSENKDSFLSFRRDFTDLLEYSYPIVGLELFEILVDTVYSTLQERDYNVLNWEALECALYCLNGFAETIENSEEAYTKVEELFSSSLLEDLPMAKSSRVRQTAVNLIGSLDSFFEGEKGKPYLSQALDYLFKSLRTPPLALTASKSIQKLCDSSRGTLIQLLPDLLEVYKTLSLFSGLNSTAHDRTVNAISCIIQALPDLTQKAHYLDQLISMLIQQIDVVLLHQPSDKITEWCVVLLRSIATIGKGLQVPDDVPNVSLEESQQAAEFWDHDGFKIRERVTGVIKALVIDHDLLNKQSDICKASCDIFKSGLCEVISGPFTFPIDTILTFITSKYNQGPISTVPPLVDLSCYVITSNNNSQKDSPRYINVLLEAFFSGENTVVDNSYEPDIQSGQLKLLTQICQYRFSVFVAHPNIQIMAEFATRMLASSDSFVLRGACQFWCKFISNTSSSDQAVLEQKDRIFEAVGAQIVAILADKISGGTIRSDLEFYSDVIKRIIFKYPMISKPWFTSSIINQPVTASLAKRDEKIRREVVTKLFSLRGGKETSTVVKEFWLSSRGITDYT